MTDAQYSALHNNSAATASVALARKPRPGASGHKAAGHKPPAEKSGGWAWLWVLPILAAVAAGVWFWQIRGGPGALPPVDLVQQFQSAAKGEVIERHIYGGEMTVDRNGGQVTVTARAVPPKACVSAGWELARKGVLTINGVTPIRVSAARLSDLCNDQDDATVTWMPRAKGAE